MNPSATKSGRDQMDPKECDTIAPAGTKYPSSRQTPSFSSSSSLSSSSSSLGSSYFPDDSPRSPATPLRFKGVPFSWEQLPGIPKKLQSHKKKESIKLLPLPPPATSPTSKKFNFEDMLTRKKASSAASESFRKDPFFAALVECSKDDHDHDQESASSFWTGAKVTRSISDRFGFINLYASCKKTCAVSESIVYLPRSSRTANYGLINRRSRLN
ncbi:PREDICTED: uncharacterized protein LOC18592960 [Theobroma cacao]|uniref:Uncharacterized protein LOC18592960 n=1 Tax=Theobroma cacao TaxID=3641 RepID=A0AB32UW72_THECC|nr:PREDICTED: uncharacterized protein LOC18592960 [Theobroma cacao]